MRLPAGRYVAVVLDLDGVLTDTAALHVAAWTRLFDSYLPRRGGVAGEDHRRFTEADYRRYVDGKPRYDGVRDLLAARGISLPYGDPADPPDRETVCGLGNRKAEDVRAQLAAGGLRAFPDAMGFVRAARAAGLRLGVVSASRNAAAVLSAVRLRDRFDILVDGVVAHELGLAGKPDPAPSSRRPGGWARHRRARSWSRPLSRGSRPGVAAASASWWAWRAPGRRRTCGAPAPTR